jgi:hypothetical protein
MTGPNAGQLAGPGGVQTCPLTPRTTSPTGLVLNHRSRAPTTTAAISAD